VLVSCELVELSAQAELSGAAAHVPPPCLKSRKLLITKASAVIFRLQHGRLCAALSTWRANCASMRHLRHTLRNILHRSPPHPQGEGRGEEGEEGRGGERRGVEREAHHIHTPTMSPTPPPLSLQKSPPPPHPYHCTYPLPVSLAPPPLQSLSLPLPSSLRSFSLSSPTLCFLASSVQEQVCLKHLLQPKMYLNLYCNQFCKTQRMNSNKRYMFCIYSVSIVIFSDTFMVVQEKMFFETYIKTAHDVS